MSTCLIAATNFGHEDVVALLLEQPGLYVNVTDEFGDTASHIALIARIMRVSSNIRLISLGLMSMQRGAATVHCTALHIGAERAYLKKSLHFC